MTLPQTTFSRPRCGRAKNIVPGGALLLPFSDLISDREHKPDDAGQFAFNRTS